MPVKILPVTPMNAALGAIGEHVRYCRNLYAVAGSYRPLPAKEVSGNHSLTGAPVNALYTHRYPTSAGTASYTGDLSNVYAGTKTRIYQMTSTTATDVSRAANYAQTVGDEPCAWSLCSFGKDVIASNYVDEVQIQANASGLFANLITSAFKPQARFAAVARTSLILANLEGSLGAGTGFADEFAWSVFGNAASFDTAGGAGRQRSLMHPGQITGLVGGDGFRLFKATSITGLTFTGSSAVPWREDEISGSVGTLYGKSIVQTKEGEIAFWGGDGFYKQSGMNPPQRIGGQLGWELINYGIPGAISGTLTSWTPLKLVTYPTGMLTEDKVIHGVRCARTGVVIWYCEIEQAFGPAPADKSFLVIWDPSSDLWSFGFSSFPVAAVAQYPDLSADFILSGIVGMTWNGSTSSWFRYSDGGTEQATIRWGAMPLAMDSADRPVTVKVRAVMPLFTWDADLSNTAPPPQVFVTVRLYDDPYLSEDGGFQPRTAALRLGTNSNDWGWMDEPLEGRLVQIDLIIDPTEYRIPQIAAVAIDYEVVT